MNKRSLSIFLACFAILIFAGTSRAEIFTAYLTGAQEVPAVATTATGFARISVNEAAGTIGFTIVFNGLSSSQISSHIHAPAAIGANAGIAINLGVVGGTSGTITGSAAITPTQLAQLRQHLGYVNVHSSNFPGGEIRGQLGVARPVDYDGDGRTDPTVIQFAGVAGVDPMRWWIANSTAGTKVAQWGNWNTDDPAPGDWDGDGRADIAIYRFLAGNPQEFWILLSSTNDQGVQYYNWGRVDDLPVQRDYDGDGRTDTAVYRNFGTVYPGQAEWYIIQSATNTVRVQPFGLSGDPDAGPFDWPIPGDYDGDGKFDIAVYRWGRAPLNNVIVLRSSDGAASFQQWGNFASDYILPGDYDGDGKYEIAAGRFTSNTAPLVWWIRRSSDGAVVVRNWGVGADIPVQGDYDGDARTDLAVMRQASVTGGQNFWWINQSLDGSTRVIPWGARPNWPVNRFDIR